MNTHCHDLCDGFECNCNSGYKMARGKCVPDCDINQCKATGLNKPQCPVNSNCKDLCNGYECVCKRGLTKNGSGECCDKEQCKTSGLYSSICPANSTCKEKCIGYDCICDAGYIKKNGKCIAECDAEQCKTNDHSCSANSDCIELCDGYKCDCRVGFTKKNGECCDDNRCELLQGYGSVCPANANCVNQCNGFECQCKKGFKCKDQCDEEPCNCFSECERDCDEDQCSATNGDACPIHATCLNKCHGFDCICDAGFHMKKGECVVECDENQCLSNYACPSHSTCIDECDGFDCTCNIGYEYKDNICIPIYSSVYATDAKKPSNHQGENQQFSSTYGDPHYHINGINATQPDLCFDLNDKPGSNVELIRDENMSVIGTLFQPVDDDGIYFQKIRITSHNNVSLVADGTKWNIEAVNERQQIIEPIFNHTVGIITYDDLALTVVGKTRNGYKFNATLVNGPTFE